MKAELTHTSSLDLETKKIKIHNDQQVAKQPQYTMKTPEKKFAHKHIMLIDDNDLDNFINEKYYHLFENPLIRLGGTDAASRD